MLVNAMNYQDDAEYYGGYPNGYIKVAGMSDLEITKNATPSTTKTSRKYSQAAAEAGIRWRRVMTAAAPSVHSR